MAASGHAPRPGAGQRHWAASQQQQEHSTASQPSAQRAAQRPRPEAKSPWSAPAAPFPPKPPPPSPDKGRRRPQQLLLKSLRRLGSLWRGGPRLGAMAAPGGRWLTLALLATLGACCLLASIGLSRGPGQASLGASGSYQRLARASPAGLELRSFVITDLTQCAKTFALARYLVTVEVAARAPPFRQLPAPAAAPAPAEHRYALAPSPFEGPAYDQQPPSEDPLAAHIEPVGPRQAPGEPAAEQLAALLAAAAAATNAPPAAAPSVQPLAQPRERRQAAPEVLPHPLEVALKQLNARLLNQTLFDCFLVDTDKRLGQRLQLEEAFRHVSSTRLTRLPEMLQLIADCRQLTWDSLPADSSRPEPLPLPVEPTPAPEVAGDSLSALFDTWLTSNDGAPSLAGAPEATSTTARPDEAREQRRRAHASYLNMGLSMLSGIVPNTLWCGLGDRASNYSQLGPELRTDSCCRAHDHCPVRVRPLSADYGLVNWSVSTRSHCACDLDFGGCLNKVNTTLAHVIRTLYFRFVGLQCLETGGSTDEASTDEDNIIINNNN